MSLDRIDRAIYTSKTDDPMMRESILRNLGIAESKQMIKDHHGELLIEARQTATVLNRRFLENPTALDLVVFAGQVNRGSWQAVVELIYELVGRRINHKDLGRDLIALDKILDRIMTVRDELQEMPEFGPLQVNSVVASLQIKAPPMSETLLRAVHDRFMLMLLPHRKTLVRQGKLLEKIGIIDGAFTVKETIQNSAAVTAHLESRLRERDV